MNRTAQRQTLPATSTFHTDLRANLGTGKNQGLQQIILTWFQFSREESARIIFNQFLLTVKFRKWNESNLQQILFTLLLKSAEPLLVVGGKFARLVFELLQLEQLGRGVDVAHLIVQCQE